MALFGVLSLGQIVFLPGYLLLRALRLGTGILGTCILAFALSLVINHFLVAGLVVLGIYRPALVYAVFAAELVLLLAGDRRRLRMGLAEAVAAWRHSAGNFFQALEKSDAIATHAMFSPGTCAGQDVGCVERTAGETVGLCTMYSWSRSRTPKNASRGSGPVRATHQGCGISVLHPPYAPPLALRRALVAAAVAVIGGFALSGIAQTGQIFQQWDAVVSWNRWAVDWAANRLPYATSIYPQLLPTNLSLSYVFMQSSEVWIFAKAFQFLFCLLLLLAMLDLARIEGKFGYVPGVLITYGLLVALLRFRMLSSGYADVPLAFFALASIYVLMRARNTIDPAARAKLLIVGAVLAAGAALTKQSGLYITAVFPLLAWRFVLRGDGTPGLRRHLPALLRMCSILCLLVLPWYLHKCFDFQARYDSDNTARLLTDFHQGRDLLQRLFHAGKMVLDATTPLGAVLLLIAVAASLRDPLQRWLVGVLVVPLGLIWAAAFSYDLRNLAMIVPWVGMAAGIGAMQIFSWADGLRRISHRRVGEARKSSLHGALREPIQNSSNRFQGLDSATMGTWCPNPPVSQRFTSRTLQAGEHSAVGHSMSSFLWVGHAVGLLTLLLITVCLCVSNETLLTWQRRQQRMVGVPELNSRLYAYAADHPGQATIATDYQAMRWLPELGRRSVVCTCHEFSAFRQTFDRPEVRYVLVRTLGAATEVRAFLESQTAAQLVFENHGFAFFEKQPDDGAKVAAAP